MKPFNSIFKTLAVSVVAVAGTTCFTAEAAGTLSNGSYLPKLLTKTHQFRGWKPFTVNDLKTTDADGIHTLGANGSAPSITFDELPVLDYLTAPDGKTWYYTAEYIIEKIEHNEFWTEEMKTGFTITIYDEYMQKVGAVSDKIEFLPGETRARDILPEPSLTRHFFNTDDKMEILVQHVMNTEEYVNHNYYRAYSIGGEKDPEGYDVPICTIEGLCADAANAGSGDNEDFYFTFYTNPDLKTFKGTIPSQEYIDFLNQQEYTLYTYGKATDDTSGPVMLFQKGVGITRVPGDTTNGLYFISKAEGGKMYFFYSQYAKPYLIEPVVLNGNEGATPDNSFVIDAYVASNGKVEPVSTTTIPVEMPESGDQLRMAYYSIGSVAWTNDIDMSVNGTTSAPAYIVAHDIEIPATEELTSSYEIYNNAGKLVRTIASNTESLDLYTLPGIQPQIMTIYINDDADYVFGFYNLYDGNKLFEIPQINQGDPLMAYGTMVYNPEGAVNYVFQLQKAAGDDDGNLYARTAWFNADGSKLRTDNINMGKDVQAFTINLDPVGLVPDIYDADDEMEYAVLVKRYNAQMGTTRNEFVVVDHDGAHYANFSADDGRGDPFMFTLIPGTPNRIMMTYRPDQASTRSNVDFYDLPFLKSGINDVVAGEQAPIMRYDGSTVTAPGANIDIYAISGMKVAGAANEISVKQLQAGIYVVVAIDANGNREIKKISVR